MEEWPVGLAARTSVFQAEETGSIPVRVAEGGKEGEVVELEDTQHSECCARRAWEFDSPLRHWTEVHVIARSRVSQCSAGPHKPGPWVQLPDPLLLATEYANRQSGQVEGLVFVGSTPTSVTVGPLVQREDAWFAPR